MTLSPGQDVDANRQAPRKLRRWIRLGLSVLMLAATAVYVGRLLHGQSDNLRMTLDTLSTGRILFGLALATLTLMCPAFYHALAVERLTPVRGARLHIAAAFAISQVVRYVPGKVFGVLFELNYLRGTVGGDALVFANASQTFYQYLVTVAGAIPLAAVLVGGSPWYWSLAAITAGGMILAHRLGWCEHLLIWMARRIPGLRKTLTASVDARHATFSAPLMQGLEWLFLIIMWYAIDLGTNNLTPYVLLATCYTVASVLGSLAILVPSGLFVREGAFVWLAHFSRSPHFDPVALIVYAAIIRLWFTGADVLVAIILGVADRMRRRFFVA